MSAGESDSLKQWSARLESAQKLIAARETHAARVALEELISFVDKTWGASDVHLISPLRLMAASHYWEHEPLDPNNEAQLECLRRALAIARLNVGWDDSEVAALAGQLGSALVVAGAIDDGCALMSECLAIASRLGESDWFSRYLDLIAHARMAQGRPQEALGFFEQAVSAYKRNVRSAGVLAIAHYHLGRCLRRLGRSKDALVQFELALSVARAHRSGDLIARLKHEIELVTREL